MVSLLVTDYCPYPMPGAATLHPYLLYLIKVIQLSLFLQGTEEFTTVSTYFVTSVYMIKKESHTWTQNFVDVFFHK